MAAEVAGTGVGGAAYDRSRAAVYLPPLQVAGEEDALDRGALQVLVHPAAGGTFLATCVLGFENVSMPTGVFACPNPDELCAVAGGYAYVVDTTQPQRSAHLSLKPVVHVLTMPAHGLLVFAGFHSLMAWGAEGIAWETARLSWEGIRLDEVGDVTLHGFGWNMQTGQGSRLRRRPAKRQTHWRRLLASGRIILHRDSVEAQGGIALSQQAGVFKPPEALWQGRFT